VRDRAILRLVGLRRRTRNACQSDDARPLLGAHGELNSDLWLDQPDAHSRLDGRVASGSLSEADAVLLRKFVDDGYLTTSIPLEGAVTETLDAEIGRLWRERPANLSVSVPGPGDPTALEDFDGDERQYGYRIPDLHGSSPTAMSLYLQPEIFRLIELIFDQQSVAFQSLYFEHGSMQGLHRDPMFAPTRPVPNLVAAWIALEDITPDSGPLFFLPGSHRFPWFEFEENSVALTPKTRFRRAEYQRWIQELLGSQPQERKRFVCRRGDVMIWHAGLMHGGSQIENRATTRKSFVVHYSTAATYHERRGHMQVREHGQMKLLRASTTTIAQGGGARGFDSPMKHARVPVGSTDLVGAS
jgi:phytanoyl-CoA hydroxylase